MNKSRNSRRNASFAGIQEVRSCNVLPDTNKHEKAPAKAIDIDALRAISRIVLAIQKKIDAADNPGNDSEPRPAGNPSSAKINCSNSGTHSNRGEEESQ